MVNIVPHITRTAIVLFFCLFFFLGCVKNSDSLETRLENFKSLLSPEIETSFNQGDLKKVSDFLKNQVGKNPDLNEKLLTIKKFEAINFFTEEETVSYFYKYFYKKDQNQ